MSLTSKIHHLHITHTVGAYNAQIFSQYIYFLSSFDVVNYAISEIQKGVFFPPHLLFFLSTQIKFKAKNYRQWFKIHVLIYNMEI